MINSRSGWMFVRWLILGVLVQPGLASTVLVSNFAVPEQGATPIGNNPHPVPPPDLGPWYWAAQSFMTDTASYALDSVEVIAGEASDMSPLEIFAALYSDDNGEIGSFLGTLSVTTDLVGTHSPRTFVAFNPIALAPDTTYWFVLGVSVPGDGTYFWYYADSQLFSGPGNIGGSADSDTSGSSWNYNNVRPYFIQVKVTVSQDEDGDQVDDLNDVCCGTPPGALVDAEGRPVGDLDLDCDNDLADAALSMQGFTGPLNGPTPCP